MAAVINLKVKSDFKAASADLKKFGTISEAQRKKIERFQKEFKDDSIDQFTDRTHRATAAIKATKGPLAALTNEYKAHQREIERLIRRGLDPQDEALKPLIKKYNQLEREIEDVNKAQKKTARNMSITEGAMKAAGAAAVFLGAKALDSFREFSAESLKAASDAEEIEGKYKVVFRDISQEAADAAATIAEDFDLAGSTVNKLLGDTGDILTGLGFDQKKALELSQSVGTLALDLASFTNFAGGAEGASAALTKALLGEAESVKALGIVIRQDTKEYKALVAGIMEVEQVGLVQAKALAALQIATEQSKNAIGDYARTMESTANISKTLNEQIKVSKEVWGELLNEGITPIKKGYRDLLTAINKVAKAELAARKFSKDFQDQTIDENRSLQELEETLAGLEKRRGQTGANPQKTEAEITAVKALITAYGIQDTFLIKAIDQKRVLAQVGEDEATLFAANAEIEIAAREKLESLHFQALSDREKGIQALQTEIDEWSKMRDVAGVQALLNQLIKDKNALIEEGKKEVEELKDAEIKAAKEVTTGIVASIKERQEKEKAAFEAKRDQDKEAVELGEERIKNEKEAGEAAEKAAKKATAEWDKSANKISKNINNGLNVINSLNGDIEDTLGAVGSTISDIGDATGDVTTKAIGMAITVASSIIDVFKSFGERAEQMKAQAAQVATEIAGIALGERKKVIDLAFKIESDAIKKAKTIRVEAAEAELDLIDERLKAVKAVEKEKVDSANLSIGLIDKEIEKIREIEQAQFEQISNVEQQRIDSFFNSLSVQEQLALRAAGIIQETTLDRIQREKDEAIAAGDEEALALLKNEEKIEKIRDEANKARMGADKAAADAEKTFADDRVVQIQSISDAIESAADSEKTIAADRLTQEGEIAAAQETATESRAAAEKKFLTDQSQWAHDKAVFDKDIKIAQAEASKQSGLADLPWYTSVKNRKKVNRTYNSLIDSIRTISIPSAKTFQTGTGSPFTVPDSSGPSTADNQSFRAGPGEEVTVTPRGESGNGVITAMFILNDEVLATATNRLIESGDIRITQENIQGGAATA